MTHCYVLQQGHAVQRRHQYICEELATRWQMFRAATEAAKRSPSLDAESLANDVVKEPAPFEQVRRGSSEALLGSLVKCWGVGPLGLTPCDLIVSSDGQILP